MKATTGKNRISRRSGIVPSRRSSKKVSVPREIGIRTVLVPTDFSRASMQAVKWARFMAQGAGENIHLVHAHDLEYPLVLPISPPIVISEADTQDRLRRELTAVAIKYGIAERGAHCHIRTGRAFNEICKVADEIHADLIVTSTHGHTGWERVFLGSTAERVVRHAACPVLVVRRSKAAAAREPRLKKIVVPVDFSDCSREVLMFAVKLAHDFDAKLLILHGMYDSHFKTNAYATDAEITLRKYLKRDAEKQMRRLVRETDLGGVAFKTAIKFGFPEEEICDYAEKESADMILMSSHGRTGLRHLFIGSTAEHIVRHAKGSVLVVPNRSLRERLMRAAS